MPLLKPFILQILLLFSVLNIAFSQGWEATYGGNQNDEWFDVIQTANRGYIAVGKTASFGAANNTDILVIRLDIDGNEVWSKRFAR